MHFLVLLSIFKQSFISIPFCTFQDMVRTSIYYEKQMVQADNLLNAHGMGIVLVHCTSSH